MAAKKGRSKREQAEQAKAKIDQSKQKSQSKKSSPQQEEQNWQAKHVADLVGVTPFKFRKFLRSLSRYNDGKYTRYRFTETEARKLADQFNEATAKAEEEKANEEEKKAS